MSNPNDPVQIAFECLMNAENKERAYQLTNGIETLVQNNQFNEETEISVQNILAGIYIWNEDYKNAEKSQHFFLSNKVWCETYEETVESYLVVVFSKNNVPFIKSMIDKYPIIKSNFLDLYQSYLSMTVNPDEEEYYNPNNIYYFEKLQTALRMYS